MKEVVIVGVSKKVIVVIVIAIFLSSCAKTDNVELHISLAASLRYSFDDKLIPKFEQANTGVKIVPDYGGSGTLAIQIEEGKVSDLFISAAKAPVDKLISKEYINKKDTNNFLENKLVFIASKKSNINSLKDIYKAKSIAIGDPRIVPAGKYAKNTLENLKLYDKLSTKISLATDVTQVLEQVSTQVAEVGLVYMTDAQTKLNEVKVVEVIDEKLVGEKVVYPMAIISSTKHRAEVEKFVEFLYSDFSKKVFRDYGYKVIGG